MSGNAVFQHIYIFNITGTKNAGLSYEATCRDPGKTVYDAFDPDGNLFQIEITHAQLKSHKVNGVEIFDYVEKPEGYAYSEIKALVDELKAKDWIFAYIGANQDVEAVAATISITNTLRFNATSAGVHGMAGIVSRSRERLYSCMAAPDFDAEEANENFFDEEK